MPENYKPMLGTFRENIHERILNEFNNYQKLCSNGKVRDLNQDTATIKAHLNQSITEEINSYLGSVGINQKISSKKELLENKKQIITQNPSLEIDKLDKILKPYEECLDHLDEEVDKASSYIVNNVKNEKKANATIIGICATLGAIAIGIATFVTAGAFLGAASAMVAIYNGALLCAGAPGLVAFGAGLGISGGIGAFASVLSGIGITASMSKNSVNFDEKTLNNLGNQISQIATNLPSAINKNNIVVIPSNTNKITPLTEAARNRDSANPNEVFDITERALIEEMGSKMKKNHEALSISTLQIQPVTHTTQQQQQQQTNFNGLQQRVIKKRRPDEFSAMEDSNPNFPSKQSLSFVDRLKAEKKIRKTSDRELF